MFGRGSNDNFFPSGSTVDVFWKNMISKNQPNAVTVQRNHDIFVKKERSAFNHLKTPVEPKRPSQSRLDRLVNPPKLTRLSRTNSLPSVGKTIISESKPVEPLKYSIKKEIELRRQNNPSCTSSSCCSCSECHSISSQSKPILSAKYTQRRSTGQKSMLHAASCSCCQCVDCSCMYEASSVASVADSYMVSEYRRAPSSII